MPRRSATFDLLPPLHRTCYAPMMESVSGKLLVSSSSLLDPNFARTLILMVRHDETGALGLVLNHRLDITVARMCRDAMNRDCLLEGFLYQGGPCEGPLMVVHTQRQAAETTIVDGLYFTTDREKIEFLVDHPAGPTRFFVQYSGWSAGQLESEMESGAWLTLPATPSYVFDDSDNLWTRVMLELSLGKPVNPRLIPPDPSVN